MVTRARGQKRSVSKPMVTRERFSNNTMAVRHREYITSYLRACPPLIRCGSVPVNKRETPFISVWYFCAGILPDSRASLFIPGVYSGMICASSTENTSLLSRVAGVLFTFPASRGSIPRAWYSTRRASSTPISVVASRSRRSCCTF